MTTRPSLTNAKLIPDHATALVYCKEHAMNCGIRLTLCNYVIHACEQAINISVLLSIFPVFPQAVLVLFYYLMIHTRLDFFFFFFNDPAPPEISPLPLHDPLPI